MMKNLKLLLLAAAAAFATRAVDATQVTWLGSAGGILNEASSRWSPARMPTNATDAICFRYTQSAPLYFTNGVDGAAVNWQPADFYAGDSDSLRFNGTLALGKGNSILVSASTAHVRPIRHGSVLRLTSGTMGYTTDSTGYDMIVGGDGKGSGTLILDGKDAKWQMGYGQGSRFGYSSADTAALIVTNGATFVGPLTIGTLGHGGEAGHHVYVSGAGSKYLITADYTKNMIIGGSSSWNSELRISDGARFENRASAVNVMVGYGKAYGKSISSNNVIRLESGSSFYTAGSLFVGHLPYGGGNNRLEITGGSKVQIGGTLYAAYNDESTETQRDTGTKILVSGEGSELTVTNHIVLGYRYADNGWMIIESNAVVRPLNRFHIGSEYYGSSNTTVLVRDGGILDLSGSQDSARTLFVGWNADATDHALIIDKGGYLYQTNGAARACGILGGARNRIEVRDGGRWHVKNMKVNLADAKTAADAQFIVRDGGVALFDCTDPNNSDYREINIGRWAPRARLLVDNGKFLATNCYLRSANGGSEAASNSVIAVVNGGHLVCRRLLLGNQYAKNATLAITNGLVEVMTDSFQAGLDGGTDNHVAIGGTNSYLKIKNASFHAKNKLSVDFDIPEAGVSAEHPIIEANKVVADAPIAITVRTPAVNYGPRTVTLIKAKTTDIDYSDITVTLDEAKRSSRKPAKIVCGTRAIQVVIPSARGTIIVMK